MAETVSEALKRGVGIYAGLGVGLLVAILVLAPMVQTVALDADIPTGFTDAKLLVTAYVPLVTGLALLGAFVTGSRAGRTSPRDLGPAVVNATLVGVVGVVILLVLGFVGLSIGISAVALPEEDTAMTVESLALSFLLLVPVVATSVVTSLAASRTAAPAGPPRRTEGTPAAAKSRPPPRKEPAPGAAGGGSQATGPGPVGGQAPATQADVKRLRCPSCEVTFETQVSEGDDIVCPECGYTSRQTA